MVSLRGLRPVIAAIPTGDLHSLTRERALLGCSYLGCSNRPKTGAASEQEVVLSACEHCSLMGPKYCSKTCADLAYREHHHVACRWKT